jgi:hypothetical protein
MLEKLRFLLTRALTAFGDYRLARGLGTARRRTNLHP